MIGTAGLPHVIVRFFTVPRVRDARMSAGWALLFIAILYTDGARGRRAGAAEPDPDDPERVPSAEADGNLAYGDRPGLVPDLGGHGADSFRGQERRRSHPVLQRGQRQTLRSPPATAGGQRARPSIATSSCSRIPRSQALPELGRRPRGGRLESRPPLSTARGPAARDLGRRLARSSEERVRPRIISEKGELARGLGSSAASRESWWPATSATTRRASSPRWSPSPSDSRPRRFFP